MPITPWENIAGYKCGKCENLASHFYDDDLPICCLCHQKIGSHFLLPLFTAEDTRIAHEMVISKRRGGLDERVGNIPEGS
jgi:hypothetical protein